MAPVNSKTVSASLRVRVHISCLHHLKVLLAWKTPGLEGGRAYSSDGVWLPIEASYLNYFPSALPDRAYVSQAVCMYGMGSMVLGVQGCTHD